MPDIMQKIELNVENYTNAEKKVYDLIINKPFLIEKYTIVKIAEISGSSKSAVLRFCQRLGYKGYSEFRYDMVKYLHSKSDAPFEELGIIPHITNNYVNALQALNDVNMSLVNELINDIKKADLIQTFGLFYSALPAQYFQNTFQSYGKIIMTGTDEISVNRSAFTLTDKSLVISFSISGSKNYTTAFFKETKNIGYKSYLITCNPYAHNSKYVSRTIVLPSIQPINQNTLNEHALIMIFIEIIAYLYISEN